MTAKPLPTPVFDGSPAVNRVRRRLSVTKDGAVRSKTIPNDRLWKEEKAAAALLDLEGPRQGLPASRAECVDGPRPCPMVSCPNHLYLDVDPGNGSLKLNHPGKEVEDMPERESCVLDVVDDNPEGVTLEHAGRLTGLTRERIRQTEERLLRKVRHDRRLSALMADASSEPTSRAAMGSIARG